MKFNCGLDAKERLEKKIDEWLKEIKLLGEWHDHFALWPTRVGHKDCRWMETIQRKKVFLGALDRESIGWYIHTTRIYNPGFWDVYYRGKEEEAK